MGSQESLLTDSLNVLNAEIEQLRRELDQEKARNLFLLKAIEIFPNPVFIKAEKGDFFYFNRKYEEAFGLNRENIICKSMMDADCLPLADCINYDAEDCRAGLKSATLWNEEEFIFADGSMHSSFYWSEAFCVSETGEKGLVGEVIDICKEKALTQKLEGKLTRLERTNEAIEQMARLDPVTGLYNRRAFDTQVESLLEDAVYGNRSICLLMADLDYFKRVNDMFGHLTGDHVLAHFAQILSRSCREKDIPIRYGGEEFFILLNDVTLPKAIDIAERIRRTTSDELYLPDGSAVTASIGLSEFRTGERLEQCLNRADGALYQAKRQGRNCIVTSD